jgi:hypothetical protein
LPARIAAVAAFSAVSPGSSVTAGRQ